MLDKEVGMLAVAERLMNKESSCAAYILGISGV